MGAEEALPLSRYTWAAKSGAEYYQGKFESMNGPLLFRTRGLQVVLPRSLKLALDAYDKSGKSLGSLVVTEVPLSGATTDLSQKKTSPSRPKDEAEEYLEQIDALLESEGAFLIKEGEEYNWTPKPPEPYEWTIGAFVGLGSETIKASGSVANYSGQSYTGDTGALLRWESLGGMKEVDDDPWGIEFWGDFHTHRVQVVQNNTEDASSQNSTEKLYRVRFYLTSLYKLPSESDDGSGWTLQLGAGAFRMPVFSVRDEASGRVQFNDVQPIGPRFGVIYDGILTPTQSWQLRSSIIPIARDKSQSGRQFSIGGSWMYFFSEELKLIGAGDFHREEVRSTLSCSRAANCEEASSATAQQIILSIGAKQQL